DRLEGVNAAGRVAGYRTWHGNVTVRTMKGEHRRTVHSNVDQILRTVVGGVRGTLPHGRIRSHRGPLLDHLRRYRGHTQDPSRYDDRCPELAQIQDPPPLTKDDSELILSPLGASLQRVSNGGAAPNPNVTVRRNRECRSRDTMRRAEPPCETRGSSESST